MTRKHAESAFLGALWGGKYTRYSNNIVYQNKWKAENSGPSIRRKASVRMPPPVGQQIRAVRTTVETFTIIHRFLFWGANTQNLKSVSQSSTELWAKIGFDHIWQSIGHLESDHLNKKNYMFLFCCANTQKLKSISHSSTELWPKTGFDHTWQSVGHLKSDDLHKKIMGFYFEVSTDKIWSQYLNPVLSYGPK